MIGVASNIGFSTYLVFLLGQPGGSIINSYGSYGGASLGIFYVRKYGKTGGLHFVP